MLRRWRVEIIAGLAAVAVGVAIVLGLGRFGESESDRVRDAATAYLHAFADGDPAALCETISPDRFQGLGALRSQDCASSARTAIAAVPEDRRAPLHNAEVTVVSLSDASARVRFQPPLAGQSEMGLVKIDGEWLVGG
jgi:hypothetical protein